MASQVTNYKCPACTGPLHYVGASGKLECDYCGSSYDVAEIEALYSKQEEKAEEAFEKETQKEQEGKEASWDASAVTSDWGEDAAGMRAYNCPSCGAQLVCDAHTAATSCPYCGNPTVVPGQFTGVLKPDYVIPFKLDQNAARQALKKHYHGKILLPNAFKNDNKIAQIQGVYVPFWMFDGNAEVQTQFNATRSHSHTSGGYRITETAHYQVHRGGNVAFEKIPVDASSKMPDEYMDAVEPYNYEELRPFSTAYLPGYLADKYDVTSDDSANRAVERATNSAVEAMRNDVKGYDSCTMVSKNVQVNRGEVHYAFLPVYMLSTKWKGKDYLFAMNGQTGKMAGNLPVSMGKWWALFAGISVPLTALLTVIIHAFM